VVVILGIGPGAGAQAFKAYRVRVEGEIKVVRPADLEGDGRREILVASTVYRDGTPERALHTCGWNKKGTGASLVLRDAWKVPAEAVFWDVGPAGEGMEGDRCYYLSPEGLFEVVRDGRSRLVPRLRIEAPVLLSVGQEDELLWLDIVQDWDGDGRAEAMLPLGREVRFYRRKGAAGWEPVDSVKLRPFPYYSNDIVFGRNLGAYQYLAVLFYPILEAADLNGDGRKDLLALRNGKGLCYLRGEDQKLQGEAEVWDLEIRTEEEVTRDRASLSYRVTDLNRDGCADVVVHKVGMRFVSWSAETAVFLGRPDGARSKKPDLRFPSSGLLSGVSMNDLDGDGYADMTLWSVKMGLLPMVEILLRKIIHINAQYYYGAWPGGFPAEATSQRDFDLHIDSSRPDFIRGIVPTTAGDFNRDGIKDLVAAKGEDKVAIYLGRPERQFASRAWAVLDAPGVNYIRVEDLDGDGRSDLYAYQVEEGFSFLHVWLQVSSSQPLF
jgi:hypothetical protein